ncbi:MAG: 4Fe-4S binding protein [Chromatiales bacterium]|nr:4Fe-4S binding protein [Chromatiales bacterium]
MVEDNLRVVRRGFDEVREITDKAVAVSAGRTRPAQGRRACRSCSSSMPRQRRPPASDIHRFWEQTGSFYVSGQRQRQPRRPVHRHWALIPAATGVFRDMTQIRFEYPEWMPENCTACGDCYTVCPDSAIPGLVQFDRAKCSNTALGRIETRRRRPLSCAARCARVEKKLRAA